MRKVLIISPYFPPANAADMQRVRMSLPYFQYFGWDAEVVTVRNEYHDIVRDQLLCESVPNNIKIHYIRAFSKRWTAKLGLGSIALRSLWFYKTKVDALLRTQKYDLVYFSTTQFPVCILGSYWKRKFKVPFVIDMQDPWVSEYDNNKPRNERVPKFWFSYRLNKYTEPIAMKSVDGLISVSKPYLESLSKRYACCKSLPQRVITFGYFNRDVDIAEKNKREMPSVLPKVENQIKIVYAGRGGSDMEEAVSLLFRSFNYCRNENPALFKNFHFYFLGTSYASAGCGKSTFFPLAKREGIEQYVTEQPDRLPFYQTLNSLSDADALFIPGSNDAQYTASKIFPYIMVKKPLLAIFHPRSSVVSILSQCNIGTVLLFSDGNEKNQKKVKEFLYEVASGKHIVSLVNKVAVNQYSSEVMVENQCLLFNEVLVRCGEI